MDDSVKGKAAGGKEKKKAVSGKSASASPKKSIDNSPGKRGSKLKAKKTLRFVDQDSNKSGNPS